MTESKPSSMNRSAHRVPYVTRSALGEVPSGSFPELLRKVALCVCGGQESGMIVYTHSFLYPRRARRPVGN